MNLNGKLKLIFLRAFICTLFIHSEQLKRPLTSQNLFVILLINILHFLLFKHMGIEESA